MNLPDSSSSSLMPTVDDWLESYGGVDGTNTYESRGIRTLVRRNYCYENVSKLSSYRPGSPAPRLSKSEVARMLLVVVMV